MTNSMNISIHLHETDSFVVSVREAENVGFFATIDLCGSSAYLSCSDPEVLAALAGRITDAAELLLYKQASQPALAIPPG